MGFQLNLDDGRTLWVPAGVSDQPDEVAEHWFARAHLVGAPKGRMPLVEGADGLLIEADEAGQKVMPSVLTYDPLAPPTRQEGDPSWHRSPAAIDEAQRQVDLAQETGGVATLQEEPIQGTHEATAAGLERRTRTRSQQQPPADQPAAGER
jgi:hypothetical protein